ncbi:MAG: sigma 54-interacting transcriptional regulator [Pyrinomonadaceae bacterium]|nr:sigma 54-interacting transcriptional regulator [Pyrinomonadaceae bacterium]
MPVTPDVPQNNSPTESDFQLPLASMVRAVCRAAALDSDVLYEVMLKATLMLDATAPTYGLATFTQKHGERPVLKWGEGLDQTEIAQAESAVANMLTDWRDTPEIKKGDESLCLALAFPTAQLEGTAIYGRLVHPLTEKQVGELRVLTDVAQLAHAHASLRSDLTATDETQSSQVPTTRSPATVIATTHATLPGMVFVSRQMAELARAIERIKDSDSTVLITGESGTGKELIARSVHLLSRRSQAPFIPFNCTAAPADLVESLLFGHRKGSFTGAHADSRGLIRAAEGGTLFLDEIGDLPLNLQPKLLRFLQEGEVHTLGEQTPRQVNVRVVAATHKNLEQAAGAGVFREDLYYRVAALSLYVPPLRERPEDTSALISHYLTHYTRRNARTVRGITPEAIRLLQNYSWPGNVRELAAEIERLVLYTDEDAYIDVRHVHPRIHPEGIIVDEPAGDASSANLDGMLEDFERRVITETLRRYDYNVARAATALGLGSRQTLYKKLKRLTINVGDFLQDEGDPGIQLRVEKD